jgi:hypothetical protein
MRLPESKGPARGGGATGKPGSGGSGEKGRTPVKASNAKGKGDDGDRGRTAGKRPKPTKTDKTTVGEGKTVNKGSGSIEPKDKGGGDPAKPKPTGKKRAPNESTSDTGGKGGARQPPPPRGTLKGDVKKLEPAEQDFVENRLSSGKNVEIIPTAERRTPDFKINGVQHELKTISGVTNATSDGISKQMASRIMDGRGQAEHVIVDMRKQPGINYDIAKRGIGRAFGADNTLQAKAVKAGVYHNQIQSITVVGPGWEITVPRTR